MLLKTVADQKIFVTSLEKTMADQTMELEECKQLVLSEIDKKNELEGEIHKLNAENTKLKMANHNFEQELRRLESVIQSMMLINPKQMEHLRKMQPDFKFKERNIALSESQGILQTAGAAVPSTENSKPSSPTNRDPHGGRLSENDSVDSANKIGSLISDEASLDQLGNVDNPPNLSGVNEVQREQTPMGDPSTESLSESLGESKLAGQEKPNLSIVTSRPHTAMDSDDDDKDISQPLNAEEKAQKAAPPESPMLSPVEQQHFTFGPTVSIEEQKLLERVNWIIRRYKNSFPEDPDEGQQTNANTNPVIPAESQDPVALGLDKALSTSKDSIGGMDGGRFQSFSSINAGTPKRNSLLRGSNPFLRIDIGTIAPLKQNDVPPSPAVSIGSRQKLSHGMGSFRSSFSRNITYSQAIAAAVSAVENAPPVNAQPQPNPFYSDSELEEIVIIWAKMLFTVLEFLETGSKSLSPFFPAHLSSSLRGHHQSAQARQAPLGRAFVRASAACERDSVRCARR